MPKPHVLDPEQAIMCSSNSAPGSAKPCEAKSASRSAMRDSGIHQMVCF